MKYTKASKNDKAQEVNETSTSDNNDDNRLYSKATLEKIRHALNRVFQENGRLIDIINDQEFVESNRRYKDACKELKAKGKAVVKSYPEIIHTGC